MNKTELIYITEDVAKLYKILAKIQAYEKEAEHMAKKNACSVDYQNDIKHELIYDITKKARKLISEIQDDPDSSYENDWKEFYHAVERFLMFELQTK